ncbi:hypothetical protein G7047_00465 [Diaphorobacter sp. HDW4A]|uniref:hypothetical protein n=1 Tax=Diaphorobacter sp. HDW4A TaxID=2714924 RepID=UPI001407E145|nr:hypothetical protein [Diaphorobacter sp. HDW4A]QIL78560.1 hypothetical protein G7047_00465 [Diaphorobacter sp. HDW4A]
MSKLILTMSDVKKIIFLIHKKTTLLLQIKELDYNHPKQIQLNLMMNWTESELKRFHNDDIENIERIMMEGYKENEITNMFRYHLNKAKRKFVKKN